ncbi:hypothetical protein EGW08_018582, partial [Elysia chlorotica]
DHSACGDGESREEEDQTGNLHQEQNEDGERDSEDDGVTLTNESVSFTKKAATRGANFSQVSNNLEVDSSNKDYDERTPASLEKDSDSPSNKNSDKTFAGGKKGLVVDTKSAQSRRSRGSSSSSSSNSNSNSNTTNKTAGEQEDQEEPVTPKSVTFAEQLISEEISFDPGTSHLEDWEGETVGSSNNPDAAGNHNNCADSWSQQGGFTGNVLGNINKGTHSTGPDGAEVSTSPIQATDNEESCGSGLTASQLRERFERMNSDGQGKKPAPLPASRRSITGWQQQGINKTSSSSATSSVSRSKHVNTTGINNINSTRMSDTESSSTKPPQPGDGVPGPPADVSASQPAENLALRVLADVALQRAAVERMQMHSIIQSQDAGRKLREEQQQKHLVPTHRQRRLSTSSQNSSLALSRDSPSSLSISSDINDSLGGPVGTLLSGREKLDSDGENMLHRGSQAHCVDNSVSFEASNRSNAQTVPPSSRIAPALQQNARAPANVSHTSFLNNSSVISQSSLSAAPVKPSLINTTALAQSSGTKVNFHSSHHHQHQQNTNIPNRFGQPVSSRASVQSAQSVLFPHGGRPIPPAHRPSSMSSGFSSHSSPSSRTRLSQTTVRAPDGADAQHLGVGGSGENSISSDNSEGTESNLQSSASSGYHSEHSGLFRGIGVSSVVSGGSGGSGTAGRGPGPHALTRAQLPNEDRDLYTQEFVNRAPSFTFSSGSSSPYSRASNDEMSYHTGPDNSSISNSRHTSYGAMLPFQRHLNGTKVNALTNVTFPSQTLPQYNHQSINSGHPNYPVFHNTNALHNILSNGNQTAMHQEHSPSLRQSTHTPSNNTHGNNTSGNNTSGNNTFGNNTFGNNTFGNNTFGNNTFGNNTSGNNTHGNNTHGNNTSGNNTSGNNTHAVKSSCPLKAGDLDGGSNSSLSSSSSSQARTCSTAPVQLPATPLVRTNALGPSPHSRPESSNSLSSQYSTSSSTLSTIYRPLQQQHKGEPGRDEKLGQTGGVVPHTGPAQPGKRPQNSVAHSAKLSYQGGAPKPQLGNPHSKGFQPTGQKEDLRASQATQPYRPISLSSTIGGHAGGRTSADFLHARQTGRAVVAQASPAGHSPYRRVMPGPTSDYKQSSSSSCSVAKGISKENSNSYPQPLQHSSSPDSNSDTFAENHEDYRAKLADTQRNMFSKMQHPKLTNVGRQDAHRNSASSYGYSATSRDNNPAQQTANRMPATSSNQQTFQDPRGSVPIVLRSSKC